MADAGDRMTRIFRYVAWQQFDDYLRLGWLPVADLGSPHNEWSVLCQWLCRCKVPQVIA